ncbi:threonine aldolase [Saccharothrix tamanrassetensis]|uniref:Threonine aldolase n=1 Tax=Saccharothrix tamanrassetensis TaxID=1051531 RepID=A0A841CCN5_9PSEU|nr:beta-eliminating lyase-related protein [Saccharothrix tamanrassetensis]MBB5953516.1 threonine aldolase [Saccharothrix tamanrassetensis]
MAPEIRRSLVLHTRLRRDPHAVLRRMLDRVPPGMGFDEPVAELETRIAELLGKPAALFFPSGTMAQQSALRVHADRLGRRTFAAHPQTHLALWEEQACNAVHHLVHRPVGDHHGLITLADLDEIHEPLAALLLELPQREIGGLLPTWDDLEAQTGWARARGAAVHMDGARLWESQPFYDRPHAEIAALFDTVYVSLYKAVESARGAILAGDEETMAEVSVWRTRLGGKLPDAWPLAVAALVGMEDTLPRMGEFLAHARAIAAAVNADGYARTRPEVPQTPLFHIHLPAPREAVSAAARAIFEETGDELPLHARAGSEPGRSSIELTIGLTALEFTPQEVAALIRRLR